LWSYNIVFGISSGVHYPDFPYSLSASGFIILDEPSPYIVVTRYNDRQAGCSHFLKMEWKRSHCVCVFAYPLQGCHDRSPPLIIKSTLGFSDWAWWRPLPTSFGMAPGFTWYRWGKQIWLCLSFIFVCKLNEGKSWRRYPCKTGRHPRSWYAKAFHHAQSLNPKVDFIINGGDSIMDSLEADKQKTQTQWDLFHSILKNENSLPVIIVSVTTMYGDGSSRMINPKPINYMEKSG